MLATKQHAGQPGAIRSGNRILSRGATAYPQPRVEQASPTMRSVTLGTRRIFNSQSPGGTEYIALSGLGNLNIIANPTFRFAPCWAAGTSPLRGWGVDPMLATKKQLAATQRATEREQLQRKCDYLDGEIDKLVYALYDLKAAEIKVVEGAS